MKKQKETIYQGAILLDNGSRSMFNILTMSIFLILSVWLSLTWLIAGYILANLILYCDNMYRYIQWKKKILKSLKA